MNSDIFPRLLTRTPFILYEKRSVQHASNGSSGGIRIIVDEILNIEKEKKWLAKFAVPNP